MDAHRNARLTPAGREIMVRRAARGHPGELIHIDINKLGRLDRIGHRIPGDRRGQSNRRGRGEGRGWEFVHVCIDDASPGGYRDASVGSFGR
jgi:hypothetical protein